MDCGSDRNHSRHDLFLIRGVRKDDRTGIIRVIGARSGRCGNKRFPAVGGICGRLFRGALHSVGRIPCSEIPAPDNKNRPLKGGVNMSEGVKTALQTAMTGVKNDVLGIIEVAVPAGLAITAVTMSIKMGVSFFKSIASA